MASIGRDRNGRRRILFVDQDGKRKTLRLGKCTQRQAEHFCIRFEALLAGRFSGIDDETARWVGALPDDVHAKLAALGLVTPRTEQAAGGLTVGELCEQYITSRDDVGTSTQTVYGLTRRNLVGFFGAAKLIREITLHDADEWRRDLTRQGLSEATARKRSGVAKQIFRTAVKRRILTENPFAGLKSTAIANRAREYFVSREEIEKIITTCPDAEWRLIVSLARYGGLRMPSEMLALKWGDITEDRIVIHSVKTEHFDGKAERVIPLFPELREPLREVFEQAPAGSEYVITRCNSNLRTQLTRIIHRAGLATWPKLFQNMRASRATELAQVFPAHVVASWLGHSQIIGAKHYLQVRDEDFLRAAKAPEKCAQNPAQYTSVQGGKEQESTGLDEEQNPVLLPATADYNCLQEKHLRLKGLEPQTAP